MSVESYEKLLTETRDDEIEVLELLGSTFGEERICQIVKELKRNKSVKIMLIWNCEFYQPFAVGVSDMLKVNASITNINIGYNNLGDQGVSVISEALKVNQSVKRLSFNQNRIGADGARAIAEVLKVNQFVKTLSLGDNELGTDGVRALVEALKVNKSVENLLLYGNGISAEGARSIGEVLKVNDSLKELHLHRNNIGIEGSRALLDALQVNGSLTYCLVDELNNEVSALWERNKFMHGRARKSIVFLLALRRMRRIVWIPIEMMMMIGQMLWRTKCDINVWNK